MLMVYARMRTKPTPGVPVPLALTSTPHLRESVRWSEVSNHIVCRFGEFVF